MIIYGGAGQTDNIQFWINTTNTIIANSVSAGALHALIRDAGGVSVLEVDDPNPVVKAGQWNHVVFYGQSHDGHRCFILQRLPCDDQSTPTPDNLHIFRKCEFGIYESDRSGEPLAGREFLANWTRLASITALSDSEVKAIYNAGTAGKFDPAVFTNSPAQSLAEAQVNLGNVAPATILGNNTTWQTETITFTATQPRRPCKSRASSRECCWTISS